ncbi:MAG: VTT domain-containing protein [Bacteroidales bacterium]
MKEKLVIGNKKRPRRKKSRLRLIHQYYQYTGFYRFIFAAIKNAILPIVGLILIIITVDRFLIDINVLLENASDDFSNFLVFTIFFLSESFLGLIPPEIFIAWTAKNPHPWVDLTGLALLAYMGGSVSYYIGRMILSIPSVTRFVKLSWAKHIRNIRRWGGIMILVTALFPLPFSIASIAAGIIDFDYRQYLLWALARIVRFYLYALVMFKVL